MTIDLTETTTAAIHDALQQARRRMGGPASGMVLTDDYNPVEFYDARNREEIRKRLVAAWKGD